MVHHRRSSNIVHTTVRLSRTRISSIAVKAHDPHSTKKITHTSSNVKNDKKQILDTPFIQHQHAPESKVDRSTLSAVSKSIQNENSQSNKSSIEHRRKAAKFGWNECCPCSPLYTFFTIFLGLLATAAFTATLIAWLTSSRTTKSTVTTTTTTTTTTATTTTAVMSISTGDPMVGLWNTTAGRDGIQSSPGICMGCYPVDEAPERGFDGNTSTKYLSFGNCFNTSSVDMFCGINTGFHVTPSAGATIVRSLRIRTGNDFELRDPLTMTFEGSNQTGSALLLGSSWALIFNGSTGLTTDPGRGTDGIMQTFSNSIVYMSYRILMTSKRNISNSIQYSEIQLFT